MAPRETSLQRCQRTCAEAIQSSDDAKISEEAVLQVAAGLPPPATVASACQFMRLPIRFDGMEAEVNAMAVFHLLDFGSGFDSQLLAKTGKDAREVVLFGLLGMLMSGAALDSHHFLKEFSSYQVFQYFNIDASEDEAVPGLPGVVLTRQGPLGAFTGRIREVLNETGAILGDSGHANLGALILANLSAQVAGGQAPSSAALIEELAETLPAFNDQGLYRGKQVYFYRKAQLLAAQLHLRFRGADERFRFSDMADLGSDSGNVLPALLRRQGVLQLSDSLAAAVDAGTDLQGDERERALRAAAVVATRRVCEALAAASGGAAAAASSTGAAAQAPGAAEGCEAGGEDGSGVQPPSPGGIQAWQLSMYWLQQEEQAQRRQREEAPAAGQVAEGQQGMRRHVAKGTVAY